MNKYVASGGTPWRNSNPARMSLSSCISSFASGLQATANQEFMREFAADSSSDLRKFFGAAESVEPRHQRCVQACRHGHRRRGNRGGDPPGLVLGGRLEHRFGHLFHEQRNPVRSLDDVLADGRRQRIVADDLIDHDVDVARRKPVEGEGGHVRLLDPGRLEFRPEGNDHQHAMARNMAR